MLKYFASAFILFNLCLILAAPLVLPEGNFPYKELLSSYGLPSSLSKLANFDGIHYTQIAERGYYTYEQAYFPLYPILIKYMSFLTFGNQLAASLLISFVCFFISIYILIKLIREFTLLENKELKWLLVFLLVFPSSFFYLTAYTESLFLLLVTSSFYFFFKKNYYLFTIFSFLASTTRLMGAFLILLPIIYVVTSFKIHKRCNLYALLFTIFPLLGLVCYCVYLFITTGDPLFFLNSQNAFNNGRSSNLILFPQVIWRYLKIFVTARFELSYFVSVVEFGTFIMALSLILWSLYKQVKSRFANIVRFNIDVFSLINIILPTFTGTFSSIPRYVLLSLSLFLVMAELKNRPLKLAIAIIFGLLHGILLVYFAQGYFVS